MTTESNTQKHDTAIDDDLKQQYEKMSAEKLKDLLKDAVLTDNAKNICLSVLTRKIGTEAVNEFTKTHLTKRKRVSCNIEGGSCLLPIDYRGLGVPISGYHVNHCQ